MISYRTYLMGSAAIAYLLGGATAWYLSKKHYEKRIAEEVRTAMHINAREQKIPGGDLPKKLFSSEERRGPWLNGGTPFTEELISVEFPVKSDRINKSGDYDFFDYEKEVPLRDPEVPYVISFDEFELEGQDFDKVSLEYYEEDDVVLDNSVEPMTDVDELIGEHNLKKFGYGSKDPRIVYIRNEYFETDWEVRIMQGSYVKDVLGYDEDDDAKVKTKFRHEEE